MSVRASVLDVRCYLADITARAARIERHLGRSTEEDLGRNDLLYDALLRNLHMIGESAARLIANHPTMAEAKPELRLKSLRAMRNYIAHDYVEVPTDQLYRTVKVTLPALIYRINKFLASLPSAEKAAAHLAEAARPREEAGERMIG